MSIFSHKRDKEVTNNLQKYLDTNPSSKELLRYMSAAISHINTTLKIIDRLLLIQLVILFILVLIADNKITIKSFEWIVVVDKQAPIVALLVVSIGVSSFIVDKILSASFTIYVYKLLTNHADRRGFSSGLYSYFVKPTFVDFVHVSISSCESFKPNVYKTISGIVLMLALFLFVQIYAVHKSYSGHQGQWVLSLTVCVMFIYTVLLKTPQMLNRYRMMNK